MAIRHFMIVALLAVATPLLAAEDEEAGPWAGKATLGFLATSGNTENSTLNSSFEIGYKTARWQHLFDAAAINASENNKTTAEAYEVGWKSERDVSEHDFLFGRLHWRKDRFSGYDTQFSQSVGYGRRVINSEAHKLNAEIGAGARQSRLIDGSKEDETILRGGLSYRWKLAETAEFRQNFVLEIGAENTYRESATSLSASLIGNFALVASYTIKNNSVVPPLSEKTDTYTAVSLEYTF
jgi:putative salt-induced outer membrane protein